MISTATVAEAVALGGALGVPSVRQLDQALRRPGLRRALKSRRKLVASDTTVARVCDVMQTSDLRGRMRDTWRRARSRGRLGVKVEGRRRRVGVVDGTFQGGGWMSVMLEVGEIPVPVCAVRYPKRGKELVASHALIRRVGVREGRGCFDLLLFDGLYANEPVFAACEAVGSAAVVKLKKVVRVRERWLKGPYKGQTLEFRVISQDQALGVPALRESAHLRWFIENLGFKALNEQAHTKHVFRRQSAGAFNMTLLQMMGRTWLELYRHGLRSARERLKHLWDHGTLPLRLLRVCLWTSLEAVPADTT